MAHIFISYEHQHKKIAERLCKALKFDGFKTWFDDFVRSVVESTVEAVEKASVVIMCMSESYKMSAYCRTGIEYANGRKKPIIPICVEAGFNPSGWLSIASGSKMVIDFSDPKKFDEKYKQLLNELAAKKITAESNLVVSSDGVDSKNSQQEREVLDNLQGIYNSLVEIGVNYVYFSHHFHNKEIAMKLRDALKSRGFKTWSEEDEPGESSLESTKATIDYASVVIMCLSTAYQESPNCRHEAEYTWQHKKPFIPILVEAGYRRSGWLAMTSDSKTAIDFGDPDKYVEKFRQLLRELIELKE